MRQPSEDRALYYRELRSTVAGTFAPELTSATARDAADLVDRILSELIVEEEWAAGLSQKFGAEMVAQLDSPAAASAGVPITPEKFTVIRRRAADVVGSEASDDAHSMARRRMLVDIERRFLERVDELRQAVMAEQLASPPPSQTESTVSPEELTEYLRSKLPDSPELTVTGIEVVPGGRSKETILVALAGSVALPTRIVLRKDRPVGVLEAKAADEFAILRAVYARGDVPVAEPFFCDDLRNGLGDAEGTFVIMARVPGHKAGEYFPELAMPSEHRGAIGAQFATALAHLHTIALDDLADTCLDTTVQVTEDTIAASVEGMAARIGQLSGPPIVAVPEARHWLLDHVADAIPSGPMCLLQGDVGLHNMLIDADRLTALVDWEAATIGLPVRELAAAWPAATALMEWDAFADAYRAAGGPPEATDGRALIFYRVFFALGACMSSRTGGHLFRTGTKRDLLTAHSGLDAHFRAQRNLARALGDALGDR